MNHATRQSAKTSSAIWVFTCILGFGYWLGAFGRSGIAFLNLADIPPFVLIPWKGICTLGLALSVAVASKARPIRLLALALAISAIADMVLAIKAMVASGLLFSVSHVIAIMVFWRNRAELITPLRRAIAVSVPLISCGLSVAAIYGTDVPLVFALYPLLSGLMAATAILSRFPLWLCGLGAVIFICSDVLVVAWLGVLARDPWYGFLTWLSYFTGYALLARGAAMVRTAIR
jgi:hypothetical protein